MNPDKSKNPPEGEWWTGLVNGLKFHKNADLPLNESFWTSLHDKIMSSIDEAEPPQPAPSAAVEKVASPYFNRKLLIDAISVGGNSLPE